jgi:hypothetical protein
MPSFSDCRGLEVFSFSGSALVSKPFRIVVERPVMKMKLFLAPALAGFAFVCTLHAGTLSEDFSHDPALDGWQVFGDASLFQWDSVNHNLKVTWDSSQSNSYFYHPIGTILGTNDDFSMAFDLVLNDYAIGVNPNQPRTFEVAVGFLNYTEATGAGFQRGSYFPTQPDLAEFDFFQWDDITPFPDTNTVWPSFIDSSNDYYWDGTSSYGVVELPTNIVMRVTMNYTAANQTCVLTITTNGTAVVSPVEAFLNAPGNFGDYHLDSFAVESYSDAGATGSLLAHGTIGNVAVVVPPPPVGLLQGAVVNGVGQVTFASQTGWNYLLQSSTNLQTWQPSAAAVAGTNGNLILQDTNSTQPHQFYRVNAVRAD